MTSAQHRLCLMSLNCILNNGFQIVNFMLHIFHHVKKSVMSYTQTMDLRALSGRILWYGK